MTDNKVAFLIRTYDEREEVGYSSIDGSANLTNGDVKEIKKEKTDCSKKAEICSKKPETGVKKVESCSKRSGESVRKTEIVRKAEGVRKTESKRGEVRRNEGSKRRDEEIQVAASRPRNKKQPAPPPPPPMPCDGKGRKTKAPDSPPSCPTPDYDTMSLASDSCVAQRQNNGGAVDMQSLESFRLTNPSSSHQPKPPNTYFPKSTSPPSTDSSHSTASTVVVRENTNNRPLVTIREYGGGTREPTRLDFLPVTSVQLPASSVQLQAASVQLQAASVQLPATSVQLESQPIQMRLASELSHTLSRSNLNQEYTSNQMNNINHVNGVHHHQVNGCKGSIIKISVENNNGKEMHHTNGHHANGTFHQNGHHQNVHNTNGHQNGHHQNGHHQNSHHLNGHQNGNHQNGHHPNSAQQKGDKPAPFYLFPSNERRGPNPLNGHKESAKNNGHSVSFNLAGCKDGRSAACGGSHPNGILKNNGSHNVSHVQIQPPIDHKIPLHHKSIKFGAITTVIRDSPEPKA